MSDRAAILRVERKALVELGEHEKFLRTHPEDGSDLVVALDKSLEHDYFAPLVWNERNGKLVDGVKRKRRLVALGFTHADVGVVDYDEPTHVARMRAANAHTGKWDKELERELAKRVSESGLDPALGLWDPQSLAMLLDPPQVKDDDPESIVSKADELQGKWMVQMGDLFQIGPHRLICGDCTDAENWKLLLGDEVGDMVWTDPPYNIAYDHIQERRNDLKVIEGRKRPKTKAQAILNDEMSPAAYKQLLRKAFRVLFERCKPGAAIYIAHADMWRLHNELAAKRVGWRIKQNVQWVKTAFTLGMQDYQWEHEPILYGWKPGAGHYWQGGYRQSTVADDAVGKLSKLSKKELLNVTHDLLNGRNTTVIREPRNSGNGLHPTIKPLHLVARMIWNSSREGERVLESFGGSGTTLAAAHTVNRRAFATELDPKYCAVILERMTGHGLTVEKIGNYAPTE
jgi:DNA modification methylase